MQYIIITLLAMTISALLIFLLTNRLLNVHLKIKPLILCVCCALLINIVLPRITMGFVGVIETVGIVVICTIFFAFSIAYYNDRVRQQKDSSNALIQTSLVVQASTNQQGINFLVKREETPKFVHQEKEFESLAEGTIWGKMEVGLAVAETIVELDAVEKMHNVSVPEEQNKNIILEEDDEVMIPYHHLVGVEADVSLNEDLSSPVAATDDVDLVGKTEDVFELAVQEQVAVSENDCKIMINNNLQNQIEELDPINNINQIDRVLELEAEDPESQRPINTFDSASNDLDSLIDIAFVYKEQRSFSQALNVFRQALILFPSSEAAPFLVMEIGAILKNNGQYDEAISVFCEGKKLSGVQKDNVLELEFIKTIAYLRIVKNILLQRRLGFIPFNNIPEYIVKEIDAEFREWRNPT